MPEQSISKNKYNFNKHQKEKQNKILQYYRRSFKSQLAPAREITRPRRTRKQQLPVNPSGTKLTKMQTLDSKSEKEKEQKINLEKSEITQKGGLTSSTQSQYVIMD